MTVIMMMTTVIIIIMMMMTVIIVMIMMMMFVSSYFPVWVSTTCSPSNLLTGIWSNKYHHSLYTTPCLSFEVHKECNSNGHF